MVDFNPMSNSINEHKSVLAVTVLNKKDGSELRFRAYDSEAAEVYRQLAKAYNMPHYRRIGGKLLSVEP